MAIEGVTSSPPSATAGPKISNRVLEIGNDVFLKLLLAELQHQDPLAPMDNHQLVQQIAQLRAVESNMQLTKTLEAVMQGQALQTAASLLGQQVEGLAVSGRTVQGIVQQISLEGNKVHLVVGNETVLLDNIRTVAAGRESFLGLNLLG